MEDFNRDLNQTPTNTENANGAPENITAENAAPNTAENPFAGMPQQNEFYTEGAYVSPVYVTKKRGINPLAVILPIAAVVIAAVTVFILLMLNKPTSYREAEMNFFGSVFSAAEQTEELVTDSFGSEKLTVDFSTPLGELSGIDLSQYKLEINTAGGDDAVYALINAMLGEEMNLSAEMWIDRANGKSYIFFPEISDIYAVFDSSKAAEESYDYERYGESLNEVIEKTAEVYFEVVGDPATEKNAQFTVNGSTYTADKAAVHLDISQLAAVCKAFLENLSENSDTADMLCQIGGYDTLEDMREEIGELIDRMQESVDGTGDVDGAFDMNVYMKNNTVLGREIVISDYNSNEKIHIDLYHVPEESGVNGCFRFSNDTDDEYALPQLTLAYTDNTAGDIHSGNVSLEIDNGDFDDSITRISADYSDLSCTENSFGGTVSLSVSSGEYSGFAYLSGQTEFSAVINLSKDGEKKIIGITVPNICTINLTSEPSDLEFKAVPSPAPDKTALINGDTEEDMEAFGQLIEDFEDYFYPDYDSYYGGNDDPYNDLYNVPESVLAENEPPKERQYIFDSMVIGSWKPVRMEFLEEEYDLDSEEFADIKSLVYTFSVDGVLIVENELEDYINTYNVYFDRNEENHILIEDDLYYSIYYDEVADSITVCDETGMIIIYFERA